ncbi:hypothetical protein [Lacticaseibacillus paracasei]|uniref:hypothetical protein n=1 Tax=Lacticaseibacillus paracasei TaxID=1597 RepID=UPI001402CC5A|nr:hypothetical protein [Lacticaseibacillus paracasei]
MEASGPVRVVQRENVDGSGFSSLLMSLFRKPELVRVVGHDFELMRKANAVLPLGLDLSEENCFALTIESIAIPLVSSMK